MSTSTPIIQSYNLPPLSEVFFQFSIIDPRLEELRAEIGDELYFQLSEEDRLFIIETEGIVDLGYEASEKDLKRIFRYIEEYED